MKIQRKNLTSLEPQSERSSPYCKLSESRSLTRYGFWPLIHSWEYPFSSQSYPSDNIGGVFSRTFVVKNISNSLTYTIASSCVCTSPLAVMTIVGLHDFIKVSISAEFKFFLLITCIDALESTTNSRSSGSRVDAGRHLFSEGEKNVALFFLLSFWTHHWPASTEKIGRPGWRLRRLGWDIKDEEEFWMRSGANHSKHHKCKVTGRCHKLHDGTHAVMKPVLYHSKIFLVMAQEKNWRYPFATWQHANWSGRASGQQHSRKNETWLGERGCKRVRTRTNGWNCNAQCVVTVTMTMTHSLKMDPTCARHLPFQAWVIWSWPSKKTRKSGKVKIAVGPEKS